MRALWGKIKAHLFGEERLGAEEVGDWHVEHTMCQTTYMGNFVVRDARGHVMHRVRGRIVEWPGLPTDVFIAYAPLEVRQHPKGHCLQLVRPGGEWFKLHWQRPARTFDESRAYVEQLLAETYGVTA